MDLKTNVSVPLGYFYVSNFTRSDNTRIINRKSFIKYVYLMQRSLTSAFSFKFYAKPSFFSFNSFSLPTSSSVLSDFCLLIRCKPYVHRTRATSYYDLDSSISSYDSKFFYNDYRQRSQYFWIANSNLSLTPEFLLNSFETPLFKDTAFLDWRARWLSKFYSCFLFYATNFWLRAFSKLIILDCYSLSSNLLASLKLVFRNRFLRIPFFLKSNFSFRVQYILSYFFVILRVTKGSFFNSSFLISFLSYFKKQKSFSLILLLRLYFFNTRGIFALPGITGNYFMEIKNTVANFTNAITGNVRKFATQYTNLSNNSLWIMFNKFLNFRGFLLAR